MTIVRAPFRVSLFGGSTDYKSFYQNNSSFILGTTINKYVYISIRKKPKILGDFSTIVYSKLENVKQHSKITNPLIRETLCFYECNDFVEINSFSDIPSRTGLGGSSSYCVALSQAINSIQGKQISKKELAINSIKIERDILSESGGVQDQIWASYGGLNSIEIMSDSNFFVKPIPVTSEFKKELQSSMLLIYTNQQREKDEIATSHENRSKENILNISKNAYGLFLKEDIGGIGALLWESWKEKRSISNLISTDKIDQIANRVMSLGAYGAKLLGSGGCGFVLCLCNPTAKKKIIEEFKNDIFDFAFEDEGAKIIQL